MVDSTSTLRARIAALAEAEPALAEALETRGAAIELLARIEVELPELRLPADLVRARLAAGVPLLDRLAVPIDGTTTTLFERLAVVMLAEPVTREAAQVVLTALRAHRLHAEQLVSEAAVGHDDHLAELASTVEDPSTSHHGAPSSPRPPDPPLLSRARARASR